MLYTWPEAHDWEVINLLLLALLTGHVKLPSKFLFYIRSLVLLSVLIKIKKIFVYV